MYDDLRYIRAAALHLLCQIIRLLCRQHGADVRGHQHFTPDRMHLSDQRFLPFDRFFVHGNFLGLPFGKRFCTAGKALFRIAVVSMHRDVGRGGAGKDRIQFQLIQTLVVVSAVCTVIQDHDGLLRGTEDLSDRIDVAILPFEQFCMQ